jgi:seryl-tRNA synthetase
MLSLEFIRENPGPVRRAIEDKGGGVDLDRILELDAARRAKLTAVEGLKAERNSGSKEVGRLQKAGGDASDLKARMKEIGERISALEKEVAEVGAGLDGLLLRVPNVPDEAAPAGRTAEANVEIRSWGRKPEFSFQPRPHWEVGERLGILDFARAAKISGHGFTVMRGPGARLERALVAYMLDLAAAGGYTEVAVPYLVNRDAMRGTGQLPKLEEDMYRLPEDDLFLIPTAEVPVTNLHRESFFSASDLPLNYVAYSACFRREAGSYGKDTRGITRVHQFDKVELVKFVSPERSYDELQTLLSHAEKVLQLLKLPYRIRELCTADLSFAAAKCYDIEVWAAGMGNFLEVSSCSNFESFQARRSGIRFRRAPGGKADYVHTLNGSGVALPRTVIAILENYQTSSGDVTVPDVLQPYMGGLKRISSYGDSEK